MFRVGFVYYRFCKNLRGKKKQDWKYLLCVESSKPYFFFINSKEQFPHETQLRVLKNELTILTKDESFLDLSEFNDLTNKDLKRKQKKPPKRIPLDLANRIIKKLESIKVRLPKEQKRLAIKNLTDLINRNRESKFLKS